MGCTDAALWGSGLERLTAKWIVPFIFFHTAAYAFDNPTSAHRLETFMLLVLGYLSAVAILFLAGQTSMIWPRFILNEELGNHVDRARGPFLNAVANGVTLNILGLIALDSFRRKRLRGISALVLLAALPIAILATKTRAVWIAFAVFPCSLLLLRACDFAAHAGAC